MFGAPPASRLRAEPKLPIKRPAPTILSPQSFDRLARNETGRDRSGLMTGTI
jgi:hypothetical protein